MTDTPQPPRFGPTNAFTAIILAIGGIALPSLLNGQSESVTVEEALFESSTGATIPMSSHTVTSTKDGTQRKVVLVGANPFAANPTSITVQAVLVPLVVIIQRQDGTTAKFDPTEPNPCDSGYSAEYRFRHSPLVKPTTITFNGIKIDSVQATDGFMRAEFWRLVHDTGYGAPISWVFASPTALTFIPPPAGDGIVVTNGSTTCPEELGILSKTYVDNILTSLIIPGLQSEGIISPTQLVAFLLKDVALSTATKIVFPPTTRGYHQHTGSPVQTYAVMDYDTTGLLGAVHDTVTASHELAEWMNDPLGSNTTALWSSSTVTKASGCKASFEVGDPLVGAIMPAIEMDKYNYHIQELAYFSWFYNSNSTPSIGTNGLFSGHGSFTGPSKTCPNGGSYP
jgi:hypothetical protein